VTARRPSSREIEIKLPIGDIPALLGRLRRVGAVSHGRVFERNTLYDTPSSDLRRRGRLLRLRIETPAPSRWVRGGARRALLTSKAPVPSTTRSRYKQRYERELMVVPRRPWPALLRSVGLRPTFRYEKYRTALRLPGLHLDLDETPVGNFLELEGSPRAIDHIARALGFRPRDSIRGTYWDLFAAYCRRHGHTPRHMLF